MSASKGPIPEDLPMSRKKSLKLVSFIAYFETIISSMYHDLNMDYDPMGRKFLRKITSKNFTYDDYQQFIDYMKKHISFLENRFPHFNTKSDKIIQEFQDLNSFILDENNNIDDEYPDEDDQDDDDNYYDRDDYDYYNDNEDDNEDDDEDNEEEEDYEPYYGLDNKTIEKYYKHRPYRTRQALTNFMTSKRKNKLLKKRTLKKQRKNSPWKYRTHHSKRRR